MSIFETQALIPRSNSLTSWQKEMNQLFKRFNRDLSTSDMDGLEFTPSIEIKEKDKTYTIRAEVPGMTADDINVSLVNDCLILEGEKRSEKKDNKDGYFASEFSYGSFYRSIPIGEEVNPDSVKASYKDGILKVELEKVKESSHKAKKIPILKS